MSRKHYSLMLVLAVIAGLVGGAVSSWFFMGERAFAQKTPQHIKEITAEEFRLVDSNGKTQALLLASMSSGPVLLFFDETQARVMLLLHSDGSPEFSLLDKNGTPNAKLQLASSGEASLTLSDEGALHGIRLGIAEGNSMISMIHRGNTQFLLSLDANAKPSLGLYDKGERTIARLGDYDGKRGLIIFDKDSLAGASLVTSFGGEGPGLFLLDKKGEIRTDLRLQADGEPRLELTDETNKTRAVLGHTELETTRTGSVEKRPASSLVLFDKEGKVIWSAP